MTISQLMNISRQSMMNNQYALTVVSHNVANMDVIGYSKRVVQFSEDFLPMQSTSIISTIRGLNGAQISGIQSYANSVINTAVRSANTESSYYNQLNSLLNNLGAITAELDESGLQAMFGEFFSAANNLSRYPTDSSARQNYIQAAKNVAQKFNSLANTLETQKMEICGNYLQPSTIEDSKIGVALQEANIKLEQLAQINNSILQVGTEYGAAAALIDQRNLILEDLSSIMPITVTEEKSGAVSVYLDNIQLMAGSVVNYKFVASPGTSADAPVIVQLKNTKNGEIGGDLNYAFENKGQVGAMLQMVTTKDGFISINDLLNRLDTLAGDFMKAVNDIQTYVSASDDIKACYLTRDAAGEVILAYDPPPPPIFEGMGARDMKVSDDIVKNNMLIAAARVNTDDTTNTNWWLNVGNGNNILLTAELRNKNIIDSTHLGAPPDNTIEGYLTSLVTKAAMQGKDIAQKATNFSNATYILDNERNSMIAVNLDEELADMIKFQRAYEASARVFSAGDEILKTLVNLGRY